MLGEGITLATPCGMGVQQAARHLGVLNGLCVHAHYVAQVLHTMASSGPSGGSGQQGSTGTAEGVKALQNVKVAVGNIKTQLEPLLAVPWQTLTTG